MILLSRLQFCLLVAVLILTWKNTTTRGWLPSTVSRRRQSASSFIFGVVADDDKPFSAGDNEEASSKSSRTSQPVLMVGVVAPLQSSGPYPVLGLRFPHLQQQPELRFVMDTGANTNAIDGDLVQSLDLPVALSAKDLPFEGAVGMGGTFGVGDLFEVGISQLTGLPPDQTHDFVDVVATALPERSNGVATQQMGSGLLGLPFFSSFPGGVEFDWYGTDGDPPTVAFYYHPAAAPAFNETMKLVQIQRLAPVQLLTLEIQINGKSLTAILDTGAPITILSPQAAEIVGVEVVPEAPTQINETIHPLLQRVGDDYLQVEGVDGGQANLRRSVAPVTIEAGGDNATLGTGSVYIGNLPGMSMLLGVLGVIEDPPGVILGLDFLRRAYRMVLQLSRDGSDDALWIEELKDQPRWESLNQEDRSD